jgi:hypothetical protein
MDDAVLHRRLAQRTPLAITSQACNAQGAGQTGQLPLSLSRIEQRRLAMDETIKTLVP